MYGPDELTSTSHGPCARHQRTAGFTSLPEIAELHVTDDHVALDPAFFTPLRDQPLHLAFRTEKAR